MTLPQRVTCSACWCRRRPTHPACSRANASTRKGLIGDHPPTSCRGAGPASALADQLETLRLWCLGPELVGPTHSARTLRARPPAIVGVVAGPYDERRDFAGI